MNYIFFFIQIKNSAFSVKSVTLHGLNIGYTHHVCK